MQKLVYLCYKVSINVKFKQLLEEVVSIMHTDAAFIGFTAWERPLFTPYQLVLIQVTRWGRKGWGFDRQRCANYTTIWWTVL